MSTMKEVAHMAHDRGFTLDDLKMLRPDEIGRYWAALAGKFTLSDYAEQHGLRDVEEAREFMATYQCDHIELELKRWEELIRFRQLPPWERAPETHMN